MAKKLNNQGAYVCAINAITCGWINERGENMATMLVTIFDKRGNVVSAQTATTSDDVAIILEEMLATYTEEELVDYDLTVVWPR